MSDLKSSYHDTCVLEVKNLSKSYGDKKILNNISFSLADKEIVVFLGASGTGKSTILRILNALEKPDAGEIILNNQTVLQEDIHVSHKIGFVSQHFDLFPHLTVLENITLALIHVLKFTQESARDRAHKLLEKLNLLEKSNRSVNVLSGGQKQRVAIARALALEPTILCLDEPTSALDPVFTKTVADIIKQLAQDKSIIIATHDMSLLNYLDNLDNKNNLRVTVCFLDNGKIIEKTTTQELKKYPEKFPFLRSFTQHK